MKNFKSFDDTEHQIGPFLDFTCIVGPNGGGKSNIVDAICFVLGISNDDLRINMLSDLVHKVPRNPNVSKHCKVILFFETDLGN